MIEEKTERATLAVARLGAATESVFATRPGAMEISIDCDTGRSVNAALRTNPSRHLTVNLSGTCDESIRVERPGVTLSGTLAGGAIIDPLGGPAIRALGAHELELVDLTLTGGTDGLLARASHDMVLERVRAVDNLDYGIFLESSTALIMDAELSRNATPVLAQNHSTVRIWGALMEDNSFDGPYAFANSLMVIRDSTMMGNSSGPNGHDYASIYLYDSTVEYPGTLAVSGAWRTCSLYFSGSEVYTRTRAYSKSMLSIYNGSTIGTDGVKANIWVAWDSLLKMWDGAAPTVIHANVNVVISSKADVYLAEPMHGDVYVSSFGEGAFYTGAPIDGVVFCDYRGRALCSPHDPAGGMFGCE